MQNDIEFNVQCYDGSIGRVVTKGLNLKRYIEYGEKGLFDFQREGKPWPDYLPTLEEARQILKKEQAGAQ